MRTAHGSTISYVLETRLDYYKHYEAFKRIVQRVLVQSKYPKRLLTYENNAMRTTTAAPTTLALPNAELAAPLKGMTVGVGVVPVVVLLGETIVKLAHVSRVALLLWITTDRSPKKYGEPGVVERNRSV